MTREKIINISSFNPFPTKEYTSEQSKKDVRSSQETLEKELDRDKLPDEIKYYSTSPIFHAIVNVRSAIAANFRIKTTERRTEEILNDFFGTFFDDNKSRDFKTGLLAYKNFIYSMSLSATIASKGIALKYYRGNSRKLAYKILSPIALELKKDSDGYIEYDTNTGLPKGYVPKKGNNFLINGSDVKEIPWSDVSILTYDNIWDEIEGVSLLGLSKRTARRADSVESAAAGAASKTGMPVPIAKLKQGQFGSGKIKEGSSDFNRLEEKLGLFFEDGLKYLIVDEDKVDVNYLQTGGQLQSPQILFPYLQSMSIASGIPEPLAFGTTKTIPRDAAVIAWFYEQTQGSTLRDKTELYIRNQLYEVFKDRNFDNPLYDIKFNSLIPVNNSEVLSAVREFSDYLTDDEKRKIACQILHLDYSKFIKPKNAEP